MAMPIKGALSMPLEKLYLIHKLSFVGLACAPFECTQMRLHESDIAS